MKALLRFFGLADPVEPERARYTPPRADTTIGAGVRLRGELEGEGTVLMLGHFEGELTLNGVLHVGPDARVDANINATAIVVAGIVRGNLSAETRVEILPNGSLTGTVKSGSFAAADGATVKGEIWVEPPPPAPVAERAS